MDTNDTNQIGISKKLWILPVALVVIAGLALLFYFYKGDASYSNEFAGNVNRIEGNTVFATGVFLKEGKPIPGKEEEIVPIEIMVDANTSLTMLSIKIPSGTGQFNIDDLE